MVKQCLVIFQNRAILFEYLPRVVLIHLAYFSRKFPIDRTILSEQITIA